VKCLNPVVDPDAGVTELRLNGVGLRGTIPDVVFHLPYLRALAISHNPVDIVLEKVGNAQNLEVLLMSETEARSIEGIQNAPPTLTEFHAALNQITGTFPSNLELLSNLVILDVHGNQLTSKIPEGISNMISLRQLRASQNLFTGTLPTEIGLLGNLTDLELQGNSLSGVLPTELGLLSMLQLLDLSMQLSDNKFAGPLLSFEANSMLRVLILSENVLAGTIPATFLSSINRSVPVIVELSGNRLTGGIPVSLNSFLSLDLRVEQNEIDALPASLCDSDNAGWMRNLTGVYGCDSILCPPGTYAPNGKQDSVANVCKACESPTDAPYFGSIACSQSAVDAQSSKYLDVVIVASE
jgi:hypothetical protein